MPLSCCTPAVSCPGCPVFEMTQKTRPIAVTNPSFQTIRLPEVHPQWQLLLSPPQSQSFHNDSVKFLYLLFNIDSIKGSNSSTLIETFIEAFFLSSQLSPQAADSGLCFHSNRGGCQVNASWTSTALVHAHWAHLRDLWETLPLPSILYSRLNLLPSGCCPRIRGKYCRGGNQSSFIKPVGRQAKKISRIQFITLFIIQNSTLKNWQEWTNRFGNKQKLHNYYLY